MCFPEKMDVDVLMISDVFLRKNGCWSLLDEWIHWVFHMLKCLGYPHCILQDLMKERQRAMAMPEPVPATETLTTDDANAKFCWLLMLDIYIYICECTRLYVSLCCFI